MGWTYEVCAWDHAKDSDHFYWLQIYAGESLLKALYYMWWCKREGWNCFKLVVRP